MSRPTRFATMSAAHRQCAGIRPAWLPHRIEPTHARAGGPRNSPRRHGRGSAHRRSACAQPGRQAQPPRRLRSAPTRPKLSGEQRAADDKGNRNTEPITGAGAARQTEQETGDATASISAAVAAATPSHTASVAGAHHPTGRKIQSGNRRVVPLRAGGPGAGSGQRRL